MSWPENPAFVLFARDKAPWVAQCVRSMLTQSYSPMTLVFSDQGSTDGTREIIEKEVQSYNGPNEIVLLSCPATEHKGMPGLIAHINWLHSKLDHDFWITMAADDIAMKDRCKRTIETVRELEESERRPFFLATSQVFSNEADLVDGGADPEKPTEVSGWPPESKWIDPVEHLVKQVGGSSTNAWDPQLLEAIHPLPAFSLVDIYIPFCAALLNSFYFLKEEHHIYVRRPDPNNTGMEGRMRLAANDAERMRLREISHFQLLANAYAMLEKVRQMLADETFAGDEVLPKAEHHLIHNTILGQALCWAEQRANLTIGRIPPMPVPV